MDDEKELKDQRVVTMMSPSELETIDDWMFKNRIRSRGEAIRRLCQVGLSADENFYTLVDSYLSAAGAAMEIAVQSPNDVDAMAVLEQVAKFGQKFGEMRGVILTMRQNATLSLAFAELDDIRRAYAEKPRDQALGLMKAYLAKSREMRNEQS